MTRTIVNIICQFLNKVLYQAGTNKAIFSIFIGLHPSHFDESEQFNILAIFDYPPEKVKQDKIFENVGYF
jgi:hypothetical protein